MNKRGIAGILLLLLSSTDVSADQLTLHFYPSPKGVNWTSPKSLAQSTLRNYFAAEEHEQPKHMIGHATVGLQCGNEPEILAGMTQADGSEDRKLLLRKRVGLGILFHSFAGRLQSQEEISEDLEARYRSGDLSFIQFEIQPTTCARLKQFLQEYEQRDIGKVYGLPFRPLYGEGSGCSAFALAFVELAGLLSDDLRQQWYQEVRVPLRLTRQIGLIRLLTAQRSKRWAKPNEPHQAIGFWDPDFLHHWTLRHWNQMHRNAKGLWIDATQVPTPQSPIWKN